MLIDWFTVVAQIVNFAVLVVLLKHFLWGRLVKAVDEREKRIENSLSEAAAKKKEAEQQMEQAAARKLELDQTAAQMLAVAQREADQCRNGMIQQARDEVRRLEAKWNEDLDRDRAAFLTELRQRASTELLAVTQHALSDLACADVQHCAIEVFLEKLAALDPAELLELAGESVTVLSAIELSDEMRQRIGKALQQRLPAPVTLQFVRAPSLAWGIEVRGNGRRIGWSATSYMDNLEENLKQALERHAEVVVS